MQESDNDSQEPGEEDKSRSQIKREHQALQKLARELLDYSASDLAELPLNDSLLRAINEGRKIRAHAHGGRNRQIKYIGKHLAELDVEALWAAVEQLQNRDKLNSARFQLVENWRDRLLSEQDAALAEFLTDFPHADRQALRQLIRNAGKEQEKQQPPKSARQLFKVLREIILD